MEQNMFNFEILLTKFLLYTTLTIYSETSILHAPNLISGLIQ